MMTFQDKLADMSSLHVSIIFMVKSQGRVFGCILWLIGREADARLTYPYTDRLHTIQ